METGSHANMLSELMETEAAEIGNYIELHRNSDHTDPGVQTRWSDLNLE